MDVLITGASQGLGREIAIAFAREGAAGIAIVARRGETLNEVRDHIQKVVSKNKTSVVVVTADLTQPEAIERVTKEVRNTLLQGMLRDRIEQVMPKTNLLTITADLTRLEDIERVVATTFNEFNGRLDVLINNASVIGPSPIPYLLDYPLENFHQVLNTNLIRSYAVEKEEWMR